MYIIELKYVEISQNKMRISKYMIDKLVQYIENAFNILILSIYPIFIITDSKNQAKLNNIKKNFRY